MQATTTIRPTMRQLPSRLTGRQHGLSLIDMLIGLALGLFVISNGLLLLASHLNENRLLVAEARLMQELRAAAAAISRDLRRAGYWGEATAALGQAASSRPNPYQAITPPASPVDGLRLRYSRDASENHVVDGNEEFGFRLRNQAIDTLLGGSWQTLTDPATLRVTSFRLTPQAAEIEQIAPCETPCPPVGTSATGCPPRILVRHFLVEISGESPLDLNVRRSVQTTAHVRNDAIVGACSP